MKIIKDTLEPLVETWDDPGDYPNAVASGPLPSYDYFAGVEGEIVLELTDEELADYKECPKDFLDNADIELPTGILSIKWQQDKLEDNTLTLSAEDAEPDPDYNPDEAYEPDYDPAEWEERREIREQNREDFLRDV